MQRPDLVFVCVALCTSLATALPVGHSPVEAKCLDQNVTLPGRRALIITTSHSKLGLENCTHCKDTGVYGEELTGPYYTFLDSGLQVTIATIAGGAVPIDPTYNNSLLRTEFDNRFDHDAVAQMAAHNTKSVADTDFTQFDIIFMAGGWGAAWDLGTNDALGEKITQVSMLPDCSHWRQVYANKTQFLGSVCHGALGFIKATKPDGSLLVQGTKMTAVTNRQIEELGIAKLTPLHPETELRSLGADYECKHGLIDLFENDVVVDGRIITRQNQMASCEVPQRLMAALSTLA